MKRLWLFLLVVVTLAPGGMAQDIVDQVIRLEKDLKEIRKDYEEWVAKEDTLGTNLPKTGRYAPDAATWRLMQGEYRTLLHRFLECEKSTQENLEKARATPEYQTVTALKNDRRKPKKNDLGGVWTSDPNFAGYLIQLEQQGTTVRGRGYFWGCGGIGEYFDISGTYRGKTLELTFTMWREDRANVPGKAQETHRYRYDEEKGRPCFREGHGEFEKQLSPSSWGREALK